MKRSMSHPLRALRLCERKQRTHGCRSAREPRFLTQVPQLFGTFCLQSTAYEEKRASFSTPCLTDCPHTTHAGSRATAAPK